MGTLIQEGLSVRWYLSWSPNNKKGVAMEAKAFRQGTQQIPFATVPRGKSWVQDSPLLWPSLLRYRSYRSWVSLPLNHQKCSEGFFPPHIFLRVEEGWGCTWEASFIERAFCPLFLTSHVLCPIMVHLLLLPLENSLRTPQVASEGRGIWTPQFISQCCRLPRTVYFYHYFLTVFVIWSWAAPLSAAPHRSQVAALLG